MGQQRSSTLLLFFLNLVILVSESGSLVLSLDNVLDVAEVVKEVLDTTAKTWDLLGPEVDVQEQSPIFINRKERALFRNIRDVNNKIDELKYQIEFADNKQFVQLLHLLPLQVRLQDQIDEVSELKDKINLFHRHMKMYSQQPSKYENLTLHNFALSIINHQGDSVVNVLERIHNILAPTSDGFPESSGLIVLIKRSFEVT